MKKNESHKRTEGPFMITEETMANIEQARTDAEGTLGKIQSLVFAAHTAGEPLEGFTECGQDLTRHYRNVFDVIQGLTGKASKDLNELWENLNSIRCKEVAAASPRTVDGERKDESPCVFDKADLDLLDDDRDQAAEELRKLQAILAMAFETAIHDDENRSRGEEVDTDWGSAIKAFMDLAKKATEKLDDLDGHIFTLRSRGKQTA